MISKNDIEKKRTSNQLKQFVADIRQRVELDPDEFKRAVRGEGLYKVFVNELMTLSSFAHLLYPPDTLFLPVLGNQGYDVEVFDCTGKLFDKIEIANPHDGHAEAIDKEFFLETGYGHIETFDFGGQLTPLISWIMHTAKSKSLKDYSDCTLVFVATPNTPFEVEILTFEKHCKDLAEELKKITFLAKRTFLAIPALSRCFKISVY